MLWLQGSIPRRLRRLSQVQSADDDSHELANGVHQDTCRLSLVAALPEWFHALHAQQPFRWIISIYDNDRRIHYEVSRVSRQYSLELGLHFESKDRALNQFFLQGFQRHLLEIQHEIGAGVEAETMGPRLGESV